MSKLTRREFGKLTGSGVPFLALSPLIATGTRMDSPSEFPAEGQAAPAAGADEVQSHYSLKSKFGVSVSVEPKTGQYSVKIHDQSWLGPGIVSVLADGRWLRSAPGFSPEDGILLLHDIKTGSGTDALGAHDYIDIHWKVPGREPEIITGFRLYQDNPYLMFVQRFPTGFKRYTSGEWTVPSVVFPQFVSVNWRMRNDLHSWTNQGMWSYRLGFGDAYSLQGTIDILLLADTERRAIILSPIRNYLVSTQQCTALVRSDSITKGVINCGIEGLVEDIPVGFQHEHILVIGSGINNTFKSWGKVLLARSGKKVPSKYHSDNFRYPVYWDDYGAYYREHRFKEEGYNSYEDIILGVAEDAKKHGLRIGAFQVQDEDQMRDQEGVYEPRQDLFPHGLSWLREKLGVPLEGYYCWLAPKGPYADQYPHFTTAPGETPSESMGNIYYSFDYWRYIANKIAAWGDILFQHDYLNVYEGNRVMMATVDRMDTYFKNMTQALQEKGIAMQYCMVLARNVMQSTENPIMLSLQGPDDHHVPMGELKPHHEDKEDPFEWNQLIFNSAFYGAVGIWPSRDNIQTMADPNAYEDILLANLLGGELQLGHRIGECNFDLVRKTYREGDGLILKADRPISPLDRCYLEGGLVGYTESDRNGRMWYYVLSMPSAGYLPNFSPSDLGVTGRWIVYNHDTRVAAIKSADLPTSLQREAKHEYFVVAPILENGMAVIGDAEKFVTMADMRIAFVEPLARSVRVGVISNQTHNPITVGYAEERPSRVEAGGTPLNEVSSLDRLKAGIEGWFWDYQTKLWHVKVNFAGGVKMETRPFEIS